MDWRSSVAREVDALAQQRGLALDGATTADAWRARYEPAMARVRRGELPWTPLDRLHRMMLEEVLAERGVTDLSDSDKAELTCAWHRLAPWPDAVPGLTRLKRRFIIAPLSNGNVALLTNLARYAGLPWDCILGAELVRRYKPDPAVYRSAAELLDLEPGQIMMVAAHLHDLRAARAAGLRTAFVVRPLEYGAGGAAELTPDDSVELSVASFTELADRLGA